MKPKWKALAAGLLLSAALLVGCEHAPNLARLIRPVTDALGSFGRSLLWTVTPDSPEVKLVRAAGGGDAVKHGDLDTTLANPSRDLDVHMGTDGLDFGLLALSHYPCNCPCDSCSAGVC